MQRLIAVTLFAASTCAAPLFSNATANATVVSTANATTNSTLVNLANNATTSTVTLEAVSTTPAKSSMQTASASSNGPATSASATSTIVHDSSSGGNSGAGSDPAMFMSPIIPFGVDSSSISNLVPRSPSEGANLAFASVGYQSSSSPTYATANLNFNGPSIVLDHYDYVTIQVFSGSLIASFDNNDAYGAAKGQWQDLTTLYMLTTASAGCQNFEGGDWCYFLANSFSFNDASMSVSASGSPQAIAQAISDYQFDWGRPTSAQSPSASGAATASFGSNPSATLSPSTSSGSPASTPSSTATCIAPIDTKYGLPTACLGPDFDEDLDNILGYIDGKDASWAADIASLGSLIAASEPSNSTTKSKRALQERGLGDTLSNFGKTVSNGLKNTGNAIGNTASNLGNSIKNGGQKAGQFIKKEVIESAKQKVEQAADKLTRIDANLNNVRVPFSAPAKRKVPSYALWPNAELIYRASPRSDLKNPFKKPDPKAKPKKKGGKFSVDGEVDLWVWCVDCGVSGTIATKGFVKGSVAKGVESMNVDIDMDMRLKIVIGLNGTISVALPKLEVPIPVPPITPFTLFGLVNVGPVLTAAWETALTVAIEDAKLQAGGVLTFKGSKIHAVYPETANSKSYGLNLKPSFQPIFDGDGDLTVTLSTGLPVGFMIGIQALGMKSLTAGIGIETKPSIEAKAGISGSYDLEKGLERTSSKLGNDTCYGIKSALNIKNEVQVQARVGPLQLPIYKLREDKKDLWEGCLFNQSMKPKDAPSRRGSPTLDARAVLLSNATTLNGTEEIDFFSIDDLDNLTNATLADIPDSAASFLPTSLSPYNVSDGFTYTTLNDITGELMLASCSDSNIYLQRATNETKLNEYGCDALWAYDALLDVTYADGAGRIAYYYADEMAKTGVSRLRVSDVARVPAVAQQVDFLPFDAEDGSSEAQYLAVDFDENVFGAAMCTYKNASLPAKVFLVNDPANVTVLASDSVIYSITGGETEECILLSAFTMGSETPDEAWNGVADDLDFEDDWVEDMEEDDSVMDDEDGDEVEEQFYASVTGELNTDLK